VLASDAVTLERATPDMSPLLENLLELYIHDLSEIFAVELGTADSDMTSCHFTGQIPSGDTSS
jgi:hypothetical protein